MAIILEGPDAAGKTTLGRLLASQFGMKLIVAGGAPKDPFQVVAYCEHQLTHCHNRSSVIDRVTPISHPVYNPKYRNSLLLERYLDLMLDVPSVIVVYCRPPIEALMRPEKHVWKDYDTEEHKQKILNNQMVYIDLYDEAFAKIPHLTYDYTQRDDDHTIELVSMLAETQRSDDYVQLLKNLQKPINYV